MLSEFTIYADLGNTTLHFGIWRDGWLLERRVACACADGSSRAAEALASAISQLGLRPEDLRCIVTCASTRQVAEFEQAVSDQLGADLRLLGRDMSIEMPVAYDDPGQLGPDRLLSAMGAANAVGKPCVVLDAGTFVTCDAVRADGTLLPVGIAPGLPAIRAGTEATAPHLTPAMDMALAHGLGDPGCVARSTEASLARGLRSGLGGGCERLIRDGLQALEAGGDVPVVVTGGDAELVADLLDVTLRVMPMLNLDGLRALDCAGDQ